MNIFNVVKVFLRQAFHNALATKSNLYRRKITEDPLCPICGAEAETTGHTLWSYPATKGYLELVWEFDTKKERQS